jgi:hypothetical protein
MRYALGMNFEGAVTEAETGDCRILTLAGGGEPPESTDQWQLSVQFAWPQMPNDSGISAQMELRAPMEAVLRASSCSGAISTVTDQGGTGQAWMLGLDFVVNESAGWYAGTQGIIRLDGTATIQGFQVTANLDLDAPDDAWFPLNGGLLSDADEDAGASHVGPNPLPGGRERGSIAHGKGKGTDGRA